MAHLKKDIKDEEEGHERYEKLAKKNPRKKALFKKMAKDEERHKEKLEDIEEKEESPRDKAIKKKKK